MDDADDGRRPDRPDRRGACRIDRDAPERRDRRGRRPLVLPPDRPRPKPRRLRAGELPVGALPLPGASGPRRRRLRGRRRDRRRDRRADAARADQPRALQERRDPGRRADRQACARGRRARDPRLLPVRRDRPARRDGARRRLRGRRLGEVAVRRPGQRVAVRPARPRRAPRADLHRLAGARDAVRLRGGDALRARRRALPDRDPERAGALRRDGGLRPDRGDRRRPDPRQLAASDAAADRARRRRRGSRSGARGRPSAAAAR